MAKYIHTLDIDDPLTVTQGTNTYYYHKDGLGSVVNLTDAPGNAVKSYTYKSFGEIYSETGSIVQPFTFTGREYDPESGLYFYRARYYDPRAGRFLTKDPIGFGGGDVNLYRYIQNSPVNQIDPLGLWGLGFYAGGGIGAGDYRTPKSIAESAGSGFYFGYKKGGSLETGAFTFVEKTKIGGGKVAVGISITYYETDAEKFFPGKTYTRSLTFGPVTMTKHYSDCKEIGATVSIYGFGGGLAYEEGESEGLIFSIK
jgi:RHS repeat-associated protein